MKEFFARNIDRFFMGLMRRFRDEEAQVKPGVSERFNALLDQFRRIDVPQGVFSQELARQLSLPRSENFSETIVSLDEEIAGLPLSLPLSGPPVYHFYPVRKKVTASLVLIHGWRQPVLGAVGRFARYCAARGIATVVPELPGHLSRKIHGRTTGEGFSSPAPEVFLPHLFHAVVEAEAARRFLKNIYGGVPAGVLGVSIGGWLAALVAMVFEPDYLFLISPVVAPERVLETSAILERRRREAARSYWGADGFLEALRSVSPMSNDPLIPGNTIGILSGRYDEVTPYNQALDFSRLWETRPIKAVEHGHFSLIYFYPELFTDIMSELRELIGSLPSWE